MKIPSKSECLKILKDNNVPDNIIAHLESVHNFSMKLADYLDKKGIKVNRELVSAAAMLHDIKKLSPKHEIAGSEFVNSLGFPEVASIIRKHGLSNLDKEEFIPKTWEEKIVFYSDKRVNGSKIVSLDGRFDYIRQRYNKKEVDKEYHFAEKIEKEIFGDKAIF